MHKIKILLEVDLPDHMYQTGTFLAAHNRPMLISGLVAGLFNGIGEEIEERGHEENFLIPELDIRTPLPTSSPSAITVNVEHVPDATEE